MLSRPFAYLLLVVTFVRSRPSVNKIINSENVPVDINCPARVMAIRSDELSFDPMRNKRIVSSKVDTVFKCQLFYDRTLRQDTNLYYISMIPLFNSSTVGCPKLDECLQLSLKHDPPNDFIEVLIKSPTACLYKELQFRYELRHHNQLRLARNVHVFVGQYPSRPSHLKYELNDGVLYMKTSVTPICFNDLKDTNFYMQQEFSSLNCTKSQESLCKILSIGDEYMVSCLVNNTCLAASRCDIKFSGFVYGENKFRMKSRQSPRFTSMLALAEAKSVSTVVAARTLRSVTITFQKPVDCDSPFSTFLYKISYQPVDNVDPNIPNNVFDTSCKRKKLCTVKLENLKASTTYIVCVRYQSYFDQLYAKPHCINATTGSVPCEVPEIRNVTPVTTEGKRWSVVASWENITNADCWNDDQSPYYSVRLYRRRDWSVVLALDLPRNHTKMLISDLMYPEDYILKLLTCNAYGCLSGVSYSLSAQYHVERDDTEPSSIQRITETILICVLSLLLVLFSAILFVILQKRKQFQHFRRRIPTEDIKLVTYCNADDTKNRASTNNEPSRGGCNQPFYEDTVIPENSTLV